MKFNKWMDELHYVVKIVLAIIPLAHFLWIIYQLVRDIDKKDNRALLVILDIVFGFPLFFVSYILNIVFVIKDEKAVDYGALFNLK